MCTAFELDFTQHRLLETVTFSYWHVHISCMWFARMEHILRENNQFFPLESL